MSISGSLSNALSGLAVASRSAELISANVANATTEGYGRRVLTVSGSVSDGVGQGARGVGVERVINHAAMTDRRLAEASLGFGETKANYFARIESSIGEPGESTSLNARIAAFEASLIAAAAAPESDERLRDSVDRAADVATMLNQISDEVAQARQQADAEIGYAVDDLNVALESVATINDQIVRQGALGVDVSALKDERQVVIDRIAELVPIREIPREDGRVTLVTSTGSTLVADRAATIEFSPTALVQPYMTQDNGLLSGLVLTGAASTPGDAQLSLKGGKLEALFDVRDKHAVETQAQLDAFARNLIDRFADPALDPSIGVGQPGLFTDAGAALDPLNEIGIAGRIDLNAAVLPSEGGSLSALRDGLYAPAGPPGNAALLNAMSDRLTAVETPASGNFQVAGSINALSATLLSEASQARLSSETAVAFASAQTVALAELEAQSGVDTDQEMQMLLMVEQLYAANAKVIEAVDEMLQQILGL